MALKTLLDIVQNILSDMGSDEVNSISDTVESEQVAAIVQNTYEEIISDRLWPHLRSLIQIESLSDTSKPTHMHVPDNVIKVEWIKYNKKTSTDTLKKYSSVPWKEPDKFLQLVTSRNDTLSTIDTITTDEGIELFIINDKAPTFYTTFDDEFLIFDSYDSGVESTLQKSKTQVYAYVEPVWSKTDTFVPDLPSKFVPYLVAEAKSTCFNSIKQDPNSKEEQKSRRQRTWTARENFRVDGGIVYPDYGRK